MGSRCFAVDVTLRNQSYLEPWRHKKFRRWHFGMNDDCFFRIVPFPSSERGIEISISSGQKHWPVMPVNRIDAFLNMLSCPILPHLHSLDRQLLEGLEIHRPPLQDPYAVFCLEFSLRTSHDPDRIPRFRGVIVKADLILVNLIDEEQGCRELTLPVPLNVRTYSPVIAEWGESL